MNLIGILDRIIRYDNWIGLDWIGWDWMGWDGMGWDYWIGLLDGFFYPNSDVARPAGAFLAGDFFF